MLRHAIHGGGGRWWTAFCLLVGVGLGGCTTAEPFDAIPRGRLGSLPYPGVFTLYTEADPDALGRHRYAGFGGFLDADREQDRGILYTCRAGFVDIAHLRKAADWTAHLTHRVRDALLDGDASMRFSAYEPSVYTVRFRYPTWWHVIDDDAREKMIAMLSLRIGQRLSFLATTWHEIITWFGYKAAVVISEKRSAFLYDDTTSHLLGIEIAATALTDPQRDYDEAVTVALQAKLQELHAVTPAQAMVAIKAVEGFWWEGERALKRDMNIGLDDAWFVPWLVQDLPFCPNAVPRDMRLPTLAQVYGQDLRDFYDVEIDPRIMESGEILALLEPPTRTVRPPEHFPVLMVEIRRQLLDRYGPAADRPY